MSGYEWHLQSALFTPPARITASVPQFVLNIGKRFPELLDFQFLLFYFLSLSVDFAPRVLLTERLRLPELSDWRTLQLYGERADRTQ